MCLFSHRWRASWVWRQLSTLLAELWVTWLPGLFSPHLGMKRKTCYTKPKLSDRRTSRASGINRIIQDVQINFSVAKIKIRTNIFNIWQVCVKKISQDRDLNLDVELKFHLSQRERHIFGYKLGISKVDFVNKIEILHINYLIRGVGYLDGWWIDPVDCG